MSSHLVAVYGTLRQGQRNNWLLKDSKFLGTVTTTGNVLMLDNGWYPYAVLDEGDKPIVVELYEVDDDTLEALDTLEGYVEGSEFNHYERSEIELNMGGGRVVKALIYHVDKYSVQSYPEIESGDWFVK